LLFAFSAYFFISYATGNLNNYINPEYNWLMLLTAWIFLLLALTLAYRFIRGPAAEHTHAPEGAGWGRLLVLAVPLAIGVLVPAQPLGASATGSAARPPGQPALADPPGRTLVDWSRAFHYHPEPASLYEGQVVDLIGLVIRQSGLPAGQFAFGRLVMRHCAADTYGLGLLVEAPGTDGIADGTWARVAGTLHVEPNTGHGDPFLAVRATNVDATIGPPLSPYIYPQNFYPIP
jgi:uncharacterized repeat protein (TIGR03943 family)